MTERPVAPHDGRALAFLVAVPRVLLSVFHNRRRSERHRYRFGRANMLFAVSRGGDVSGPGFAKRVVVHKQLPANLEVPVVAHRHCRASGVRRVAQISFQVFSLRGHSCRRVRLESKEVFQPFANDVSVCDHKNAGGYPKCKNKNPFHS